MEPKYLFNILDSYIISLYYINNIEKGKEIIRMFKCYLIFEEFKKLYLDHKTRLDSNFNFFN